MKNYYEILGISPDATKEEIEKVTNRELRLWSHRANAPSLERRQEAERMVALLEKIQATLTDPTKREQYDQAIRVSQQETSGKLVQNQSTNLPSTESEQPISEESPSETQPETQQEQLPLVTEPSDTDPKEEKPPFTTGPIQTEKQSSESSSQTDPTYADDRSETATSEVTKSEKELEKEPESESKKESETTPEPIEEQEEPEKVEETKSTKGKVRIWKGWIWGIGLLVVISIGLILYTQFINNTPQLEVGQEINIKDNFIFKVDSFNREDNSTRLQISIKPTDNKLEKYQNASKQITTIKDMADREEIGNTEQVQEVIDTPLIDLTIRFEDANGNSLGTLKTSDAQRITDQGNSDEVVETFLWSMSVFPKSTRYLVIETIQGIESDSQQSKNDKMLLDADRIKYQINQRFILSKIETSLAEL